MTLYRREKVSRADFTREAQKFLSKVRRGASDREAAAHAGVSMVTLRTWLRDEAFAVYYERAKAGKGGVHIANLMDDEERLEVARARMDRLGITTDSYGFLKRGDR